MEGEEHPEGLKETIKKFSEGKRYCGIKWLDDHKMELLTIPLNSKWDAPCPLAPGCVGTFLKNSSKKMESAVILGTADTKEETRAQSILYLKREQEILLDIAKEGTQEEEGAISDVEVYVNGIVSCRQVLQNTKPWDETLPKV